MDVSPSEKDFVISQGYDITKVIGQGSYAKVFLCEGHDTTNIKEVACKVVDTNESRTEFVHKFFPRELEILSKLKHPNIIQIFGIFKVEEKYFIFMRYAENNDLLDYIVTKKRIPETRVRFWAWQMASALSFMHSKDIVHRDLKCENILLTANYNVKLCDFGFGKIMNKGERISRTWCGSLAYAPPEILEMKPYNAKKIDPWALGVIIYVTLAKALPFQERSPRAMLLKQRQKLQFVGNCWEKVSVHAKTSLLKLLEVDPRYRWSPENVLSSTWISEDQRLTQMALLSNLRTSVAVDVVDRRRLSAQLRSNSDTFSSTSNMYKKVLTTKMEESIDYFKEQKRRLDPINHYFKEVTSSDQTIETLLSDSQS